MHGDRRVVKRGQTLTKCIKVLRKIEAQKNAPSREAEGVSPQVAANARLADPHQRGSPRTVRHGHVAVTVPGRSRSPASCRLGVALSGRGRVWLGLVRARGNIARSGATVRRERPFYHYMW